MGENANDQMGENANDQMGENANDQLGENANDQMATKSGTQIVDANTIICELKDIIIKQQQQIEKQQDQIGEMIPRIGNNNIINNNTQNNTQNNRFNINMFLNHDCKDAMNMSEFMKTIKVSLEQLDYTKRNGLANGLSKTIIENMKNLSVHERPLHCTDIKRETIYIKEDDEWSKEGSREIINKVIRCATFANYPTLKEWSDKHPDFREDERLTEYFTRTVIELGKSLDGLDARIIRQICRELYIKTAIGF